MVRRSQAGPHQSLHHVRAKYTSFLCKMSSLRYFIIVAGKATQRRRQLIAPSPTSGRQTLEAQPSPNAHPVSQSFRKATRFYQREGPTTAAEAPPLGSSDRLLKLPLCSGEQEKEGSCGTVLPARMPGHGTSTGTGPSGWSPRGACVSLASGLRGQIRAPEAALGLECGLAKHSRQPHPR